LALKHYFNFIYKFAIRLTVLLDINECNNDTNNCSENANCINTIGSYQCECFIGYTGDGFNCSGKFRSDLNAAFFMCRRHWWLHSLICYKCRLNKEM